MCAFTRMSVSFLNNDYAERNGSKKARESESGANRFLNIADFFIKFIRRKLFPIKKISIPPIG